MLKETRPSGPLNVTISVPGSKSITNRALICASLAEGDSCIRNWSDSDDTALMMNGLNQLGILVRRSNDGLVVQGRGGELYPPKFPIPVGNAGTTLRFLIAVASLAKGRVVFEGSDRIAERPIIDLLDSLNLLGVRTGFTPGISRFQVDGGTLGGGSVRLRGDKSSQFLSSLLMVAPLAAGEVEIIVEGPLISASYVDMTLNVMRNFGVTAERKKATKAFFVRSGQRYRPVDFTVEADASSATYAFAAAAVAGGKVHVRGIKADSRQGDIGFLRILREMGCRVEATEVGVSVEGTRSLGGVDCDMNAMPDAVPTLAAVALFARTKSRIRNVAHLRYKESDRLEMLATELRKLGAVIVVYEDGLEIEPVPLKGTRLDPHDDHRLAMSFALIGLRVPGIQIENPGCVKKSFPTFWDEYQKMSAQ